ncbi:MAG: IS701 family transposase, partial [bacterium]
MTMNPPKCNDLDYIHFLIAAQKVVKGIALLTLLWTDGEA